MGGMAGWPGNAFTRRRGLHSSGVGAQPDDDSALRAPVGGDEPDQKQRGGPRIIVKADAVSGPEAVTAGR